MLQASTTGANAAARSAPPALLRVPYLTHIVGKSRAARGLGALKRQLGRKDFRADARPLRRGLLDNGYAELPVTSAHAVALDLLPPLHKDPFDRMLIAQALVEGIMLLTADANLARYPGPIQAI